jgi:hypothetical protein
VALVQQVSKQLRQLRASPMSRRKAVHLMVSNLDLLHAWRLRGLHPAAIQ